MPAKFPAWSIGVARRVITPPLGSPMAGFDARKDVAKAVHDDLHARAMVFDDGTRQIVFVSVEVIAISPEFAGSVRAECESVTGIPAGQIFLCATHTHCGPVTLHHFFNQGQALDEKYLRALAVGIVVAVEQALANKKPRILKTGLVECDGIAVNRRTENGLPVDPYAGVLLIEELDGMPTAIAVLYACHTTVLGPDTLSITQDFPFYTLAKLRSALGDHIEAMYLNGAEGDLSIGHKSDLSAVGVIDSFRTFATAKRLGEKLADAVIAGLPSLTIEVPSVGIKTSCVALPLKTYDRLAAMTAAREQALAEIREGGQDREMLAKRKQALFARIEEYYAALYEASDTAEPKTLTVEFAAIRLGETAFLTLPGEIFVRVALEMRKSSPFVKTLFLGLANDYIGYLPDEQAAASSGYEVIASRVPASAGKILQEEAKALLENISMWNLPQEMEKA